MPHFREAGIVAVGHLDGLGLQKRELSGIDIKPIGAKLEKKAMDEGKAKGAVTSHLNQVSKFVGEITEGDLVITLDSSSVLVGKVSGPAYYDDSPVRTTYDAAGNHFSEMDFGLRRTVQWGPKLGRRTIPWGLERSLSAHQAVFNIDDSLTYVYHTLLPVFAYRGNIYFSVRINAAEDIDNYSVSQFLLFLSELPVIAQVAARQEMRSDIDFDEVFLSYLEQRRALVTTKAAFMSPGDVWAQVAMKALDYKDLLDFYIAYSAVFGSRFIGWEGALNNQTVKRIVSLAIERFEKRGGERLKSKLKLDAPKHETEAITKEVTKEVKSSSRGK